jgi:asparagine synthetase A
MWDLAKEINQEEQNLKKLETSVTDVYAVITFNIDELPQKSG